MAGTGVTVNELRAFATVARLQSFTRAARLLGVSQPALSMTLRQLEAKLGTTLLDRSTRNVRLSASGAGLLSAADRLVENFDRTVADMRAVGRGEVGRISIACPEGVAAHVIAPTLARYVARNPGVRVSVLDGDARSVAQHLHALDADFGVTGFWTEHPDFIFTPFTADRCCLVCPADHPLAGEREIPLARLHRMPVVALNRDAGVRQLLERSCAAEGVALRVQFEVARVSTLVEMVAAGHCVSVLTLLSSPQSGPPLLARVPLSGPGLAYPIGLVTPANRSLTNAAQSLIGELLDAYN